MPSAALVLVPGEEDEREGVVARSSSNRDSDRRHRRSAGRSSSSAESSCAAASHTSPPCRSAKQTASAAARTAARRSSTIQATAISKLLRVRTWTAVQHLSSTTYHCSNTVLPSSLSCYVLLFPPTEKHKNYTGFIRILVTVELLMNSSRTFPNTGRHSGCLQSDSRFVRLLNSGRPPPRARPLRGSGARGAIKTKTLQTMANRDDS